MKIIDFNSKQKEDKQKKENLLLEEISQEIADIINNNIEKIDYELLILFLHSIIFKLSGQLISQLDEDSARSLYNKIISINFTELNNLEKYTKKP